jgi:hypothetical protein
MLTILKAENTLVGPNQCRVPRHEPGIPRARTFGRSGRSYVETDPTEADASTIVRNLLQGQYDRPVRVLALNVEEGWVRDVSEIIAAKVQDVARREEQGLTVGTRAFVEAHSERIDEQQMLPLWQ